MGSQRIVSKIGDLESFGADPRRVVYAGHDVDGIDEVDFAGKYQTATGNIKERYQSFDLEYKGEENNDYVNGQGLCCTDNPLGRDGARTVSDTKDGETPERLIYFYHSDHLGSSSLITNFDGEVTQHVEYIPYGEVFLEERNNTWNTPYLFNAKELDEETGLYYYGARYLNPMDAMWLSVDPLFEKYVGMSPYNYCAGNPVMFIDPDGKAVYGCQNEDGSMSYAIIDNNDVKKYGDTYNSPGNGSFKYIDDSYDCDGKTTDYTGIVVDHTSDALSHYYSGDGAPVVLGEKTRNEIFNSEDMVYYRDRIKNGETSLPAASEGSLSVNMTTESFRSFHVGNIPMSYSTRCDENNCTTTYTFAGDGFWDIFWGKDYKGSSGELGGTPYSYVGFSMQETFKNPGYPIDENNLPIKNPTKVKSGKGAPNSKNYSSSSMPYSY